MVDGMHGSPFFVLNVINLESEGSIAPRAASKAFHYIGEVMSISSRHMVVGVWAK